MISRKYFAQLILLPVLASPLGSPAVAAYRVMFAPADFTASQMNNRGQIVGTSGNQPAIWSGNRVTRIEALAAGGRGLGINNRGDIVGIAPMPSSDHFSIAFVYTRAGVHYITPEQPWDEYSEAVAINDAGQVAGMGDAPVGESQRGFVNSRRGTAIIGTFGGDWSSAFGINSAGHVVGTAALPSLYAQSTDAHAFLFRNGVLQDLGSLGGNNSIARDINDASQIVGDSTTVPEPGAEPNPRHAFLYQRGTMKDLGTLGGTDSSGNAINNAGVVVGDSYLPGNWAQAAFVYARGKMMDLNTQVRLPDGWTLVAGHDVNDSGEILARACSWEDCGYWARLTPRHEAGLFAQYDGNELGLSDDGDAY